MKKAGVNHKIYVKLILWAALLLMLFIPVFSGSVLAQDDTSMDMQTLEEGEIHEGPGFFSGNLVQIDGTVEGTTFATGQEVHVNGTINGSLFVAAQTVIVNGEITGNLYIAGQTITVDNNSDGDVFLAGETIRIDPNAQIGRDLFTAGASIVQEGTVPRHLFAGAQNYTLNGPVGGDATMDLEQLTLQESAEIEGDLSYSSPEEATMDPNAVVSGETDWEQTTEENMQENQAPEDRLLDNLLGMFWSILGALLVWFLFKFLRRSFWMNMIPLISNSPFKTIGIGFLVFIFIPILVILLLALALVTFIGVPLAVILAALYGIGLYISNIIVAVFIGFWLVEKLNWRSLRREIWLVLLGLILLELIGFIPVVNFIVGLIVLVIGFGALGQAPFKRRRSDSK